MTNLSSGGENKPKARHFFAVIVTGYNGKCFFNLISSFAYRHRTLAIRDCESAALCRPNLSMLEPIQEKLRIFIGEFLFRCFLAIYSRDLGENYKKVFKSIGIVSPSSQKKQQKKVNRLLNGCRGGRGPYNPAWKEKIARWMVFHAFASWCQTVFYKKKSFSSSPLIFSLPNGPNEKSFN